jgi:hypothetical protein
MEIIPEERLAQENLGAKPKIDERRVRSERKSESEHGAAWDHPIKQPAINNLERAT